MRRFLTSSLITLTLLIGATAFLPSARADSSHGTDANGTDASIQAAATDKAATKSITQPPVTPDPSPGLGMVMIYIMGLFAWLMGVAALTLNYAVYYTVVNMGMYIQQLAAIGVTWQILRDIGNILLIFGFLAVGLSTIIQVDWYGGMKKFLPKLLIAAVFLNFSLFITEAVIDVGNLFATQFYKQINGGDTPKIDSQTGAILAPDGKALTPGSEGISTKIMNQLGLQTIYNDASSNSYVFKGSNPWRVGFMGTILFLVASFVMFSLAFILISRFVILVYLIITSPLGFAGYAWPQLEGFAKDWWHKLLQQTITAPILLLLLYISLTIITDAKFLTGFGVVGTGAGAATGFVENSNIAGFASFILSFIVAMGLLLFVVVASRNLSAFGAGWATKMGGRVTGALSFGAISLAGRGTFGTAGYLLNNKRMQARASKGGIGGAFAKVGAFAGRNLEKRTFDLRNVAGVRTAANALGSISGNGAGAIFEGKTTITAKSGLDTTREAVHKYKPFSGDWWRDQKKEYESAQKELDKKSTLKGAAIPTIPPNAASQATQKELKGMSADQLAELDGIRKGVAELVHNLSPEKFGELMKSDKLLKGEKKALSDKWNEQFVNPASAAVAIGRMSTEEVASLGGDTITKPEVINVLGSTELDQIRRKGNLTRDQRRAVMAHMTSAAASPALAAVVGDYFLAANDPGGARDKYWNI